MSEKHTFMVEVTAIPYREHKDARAEQGWKHQTEVAIAQTMLHQKDFSAIVRVVDATPLPGGKT